MDITQDISKYFSCTFILILTQEFFKKIEEREMVLLDTLEMFRLFYLLTILKVRLKDYV